MIYIFLADGFEETEALVPLDMLRRAKLPVKTVSVGASPVTGSHGISVISDMSIADFDDLLPDALILPGGMPGTANLEKCQELAGLLKSNYEKCLLCAICAAPSVFGKLGLLAGKKATCYPGFEGYLEGAEYTADNVVKDGKFITAKAAGAAFEFSKAIISELSDKNTAQNVLDGIYYRRNEENI